MKSSGIFLETKHLIDENKSLSLAQLNSAAMTTRISLKTNWELRLEIERAKEREKILQNCREKKKSKKYRLNPKLLLTQLKVIPWLTRMKRLV